MTTSRQTTRLHALVFAVGASTLAAQTTPLPSMRRLWGGETRQIHTLQVGSNLHVWTTGDGPLVRHAINPTPTTTWQEQTMPADVTQNLLDVHFIAAGGGHVGFACGLNGHVFKTVDYGATWSHFDTGEVLNQDTTFGPHNAVLWRARFVTETFGFVCGLWTFKYWNAATNQWVPVTLDDGGNAVAGGHFEFYSLDLVVDPADPNNWVGVAAGQVWGHPGGGPAGMGQVFYGRSSLSNGTTWYKVFETAYDDPWDLEFAPNPPSTSTAVGYLSTGTGTGSGAVYRTLDSGLTWTLEHRADFALYGVAVTDPEHVVACGYGGTILSKAPSSPWTCRRGAGCPPTIETMTGPLAGAEAAGSTVYVGGTWGYLRRSSDQFASASENLFTPASESKEEHWRFQDVHFTSATRGFAVSNQKMIAETADGGLDFDFSPGSPNTQVLATDPGTLHAIDFASDGRGVTVGVGFVNALQQNQTPTLTTSFAYYYNPQTSAWVVCTPSFSMVGWGTLDLSDVAWVSGTGSSAKFVAVGRSTPVGGAAIPRILYSQNGGVSWLNKTPAGLPSSLVLSAVAFRSASEGFAVGDLNGNAAAYRLVLSGSTLTATAITVTGGTGKPLFDVAANTSVVLAVGSAESAYSYATSFTPVVVPATGFPPSSPTDFLSVSVPRGSGATALIGMKASTAEVDAGGLGKVLYLNNGTWHLRRAATNKDVNAVFLRSNYGFATSGGGNTSAEVGTLGDTMVLKLQAIAGT